MDSDSELSLNRLLHSTRLAALGTVYKDDPNLALVAVAVENDFSAFYIHVSKLGKHTSAMQAHPRVSLLISEIDDHRADPQTLARLSLEGKAEPLPRNSSDYPRVKNLYLKRFPESEKLFSFGDFNLWKIIPIGGRFVAGFGKAFNLVPEGLRKIASLPG